WSIYDRTGLQSHDSTTSPPIASRSVSGTAQHGVGPFEPGGDLAVEVLVDVVPVQSGLGGGGEPHLPADVEYELTPAGRGDRPLARDGVGRRAVGGDREQIILAARLGPAEPEQLPVRPAIAERVRVRHRRGCGAGFARPPAGGAGGGESGRGTAGLAVGGGGSPGGPVRGDPPLGEPAGVGVGVGGEPDVEGAEVVRAGDLVALLPQSVDGREPQPEDEEGEPGGNDQVGPEPAADRTQFRSVGGAAERGSRGGGRLRGFIRPASRASAALRAPLDAGFGGWVA